MKSKNLKTKAWPQGREWPDELVLEVGSNMPHDVYGLRDNEFGVRYIRHDIANRQTLENRKAESFHPLQDSDVLNQPGSTLADYGVADNRSRLSYVSQRLLRVALLAYMKHHKGDDVIGWETLADELYMAICEAIGDDEFVKWNETTSRA